MSSFVHLLGRDSTYIGSACLHTHVKTVSNATIGFRSLPSKETLRGHSNSSFRGEGYIQCCVGVRQCDVYSNQELAEIHFMYGKVDGNAALARRLYQEMYPQRQCPDRKTFALSPADYSARVRFCQWFLQQCGVNPNLVLFTDEAQFTRDGITNFHNQHVWAYEKPRATVPSHHQVRFSLNMWAGIIGDRLFGPHVLVNRLTGQAYTNFLENTTPHVLEDTPLINRQHIHFLHDGAPAHFSRTARRYLDRRFPDRWVDRGGQIAWPARSPDLNPLVFYLWGHLKLLVYSSPVPDLESHRNRIVACSEDIRYTPGVWDRVRRSMRHRCEENLFVILKFNYCINFVDVYFNKIRQLITERSVVYFLQVEDKQFNMLLKRVLVHKSSTCVIVMQVRRLSHFCTGNLSSDFFKYVKIILRSVDRRHSLPASLDQWPADAAVMTNKGYSVYEEVHGISSEGSNRRIDIIAFKLPSLEGYIIDPTVRFESHEHQPEEVHEEKRNMYEPSISFYEDQYHLESIVITGLMMGAVGPYPGFWFTSANLLACIKIFYARPCRNVVVIHLVAVL
ncbi:hypothetical protein ANN_26587 [Periplaneta americana]|uniref:Transposable element Tc3 transposase n=1 Tax=Periplaneta americana TaxID=6978 RepID=A0ABQ8RYM1_PERAM|nr:hypothetical protein ANN_26587 [Periplaneta americana]